MVVLGSLALSAVLLGIAPHVNAQAIGVTNVTCIPSFSWADNSLGQNPCLVAAYLQSQCTGTTFSMYSLQPGYYYIGPTNDTSTQTPCICSSPVYMLASACGACQNRTFIAWEVWHKNCPANLLQDEGTYGEYIPSGTLVPRWAYLKPSDTHGYFYAAAAIAVGDTPESSGAPPSSTTSSTLGTTRLTTTSSPTSTSRSGGSGGGSSAHVGAIVGGVVGGVVGLGLVVLLGLWLLRRHGRPSSSSSPSTPSGALLPTGGSSPTPEISSTGGPVASGPNGGSSVTNIHSSLGTTLVSAGGAIPPLGPVYNPSDPSTYPKPENQPPSYVIAPPAPTSPQLRPLLYNPLSPASVTSPQSSQAMKYSGIPEV